MTPLGHQNSLVSSTNRPQSPLHQFTPLYQAAKRRRIDPTTPLFGSETSASRWFENVNQNVKHSLQSDSEFESDPPFYLKREVSDPTTIQMGVDSSLVDDQFPVMRDDSETEDLRSVIDDLTIENKRLRQMLRERRQHYNPQLEHDKIFEIRTCELSSEKKRELEAILLKFASSVIDESSAPSRSPEDASALPSCSSTVPGPPTQEMARYPHTDSAYASMSNSGLISVTRLRTNEAETEQMRGSKNTNIKSYLHDIPDSLLPKHSPIMSDKAKMWLVVDRLEQLFTGKNAAPCEHSQPLQQQKVSESAANADRHDSQLHNRYLRQEGAREAHIAPFDANVDLNRLKGNGWYKQRLGSNSGSEKSYDGRSASDNRSPDQRPTRPLDLDIHRAQVAEENIEYIRHLGLPTPRHHHDSDHPNNGWVFLNLLINMAQLHMINVTAAFVRKAIAHLSTKFELSEDGQKVRWRGDSKAPESERDGESSTGLTTASSPELIRDSMTDDLTNDNASSDNLASTGSSSPRANRLVERSPSVAHPFRYHIGPSMKPNYGTDKFKLDSTFHYKPLVPKDCALLRGNTIYDGSDIITPSRSTNHPLRQELGFQANTFSHSYFGRSEDDGPIIYYKNLLFCCDLRGDKQAYQCEATSVSFISKQILGISSPEPRSGEEREEQSSSQAEGASSCSVNDDSLPSLELAPLAEMIDSQEDIYDLLASGVGGVVPDDHFTLQVKRKRQQTILEEPKASARGGSNRLRFNVYEDILSNTRVDLPPSKLPPPSCVFLLSSGSSGGLESEASLSENMDVSENLFLEEVRPRRPAFPEPLSKHPSGEHLAAGDDDDDVDSCDSITVRGSLKAVNSYIDAYQGC